MTIVLVEYLRQVQQGLSFGLIVYLVIHGLATWRVSYMLVHETGPWRVFVWLRKATGIIHDEAGVPMAIPDSSVLGCVYCTSIWVALLLFAAPVVIILWLAASGLAIWYHKRLS